MGQRRSSASGSGSDPVAALMEHEKSIGAAGRHADACRTWCAVGLINARDPPA